MDEQPPAQGPDSQPPVGPPNYGPPNYGAPGTDDTREFAAQPPSAPPPGPGGPAGPFGPAGPPPVGPTPGPYLGEPFDPQPPRRSFVRRHRTPLIIGAAVIILGGAGAGIAVAATSDDGSSPHAAASSTPGEGQQVSGSAAAQGNGKQGKKAKKNKAGRQHPVRATIVSESTSTWTVRTKAGKTLQVTIAPTTKFGTKKAPATRTQFTVGKQIAVIGQQTSGGITAVRIHAPAAKGAKTAPTPSSSSPS